MHSEVRIFLWPIFEKLKLKSGATAVPIAHQIAGRLVKWLEHLKEALITPKN